MRRRSVVAIGSAIALGGCLAAAWLLWPCDPVTKGNFAKVKKGMTEEEVDAFLGPPFRVDEVDVCLNLPGGSGTIFVARDQYQWMKGKDKQWEGKHGRAVATFDATGRLLNAEFTEIRRDSFHTIRHLLGMDTTTIYGEHFMIR